MVVRRRAGRSPSPSTIVTLAALATPVGGRAASSAASALLPHSISLYEWAPAWTETGDSRYVPGETFHRAANNMCGLYSNATAAFTGSVTCDIKADSEASCSAACDSSEKCMSWIYHPSDPLNNASLMAELTAEPYKYFVCQKDPYTGLFSSPLTVGDWAGKCCHRSDDKWQPYIPAPSFMYDTSRPHVTSGSRLAKMLKMADEAPEFLSAPATPAADVMSLEQATVDYSQYGNLWTVLRTRCLRAGMDLCPAKAYCSNRTEPVASAKANVSSAPAKGAPTPAASSALAKASALSSKEAAAASSVFGMERRSASRATTALAGGPPASWLPVLGGCNTWLHYKTCTVSDGAQPSSAQYMESLRADMDTGCCAPVTGVDTPAQLAGHASRVFLSKSRNFVLRSLDPMAVQRVIAARGRKAVLRIVVNHETIGLFAAVQWVLLAMQFAKAAGLSAYVDHGPCTLCGYAPFPLKYKYFDPDAGSNVWEYFFKPVDTALANLSASCQSGCDTANADVMTLDSWHIWKLYDSSIAAYDPSHSTVFNQQWWWEHRARAYGLFSRDAAGYGVEFAEHFAQQEADMWKAVQQKGYWALQANATALGQTALAESYGRAAAAVAPSLKIGPNLDASLVKVLALHVRGTDKLCSIGGPIIPPENYYALTDLYIATNPTALIFIATESPNFLAAVRGRYGPRVIFEDAVRSEKNPLHVDYAGSLETFGKGFGAVVDAAHLARADFLLHANSAVSEFSHWLAGSRLHGAAFNMQFDLRSQLQNGHAAVFGDGLASLATSYNPPVCPPAKIWSAA